MTKDKYEKLAHRIKLLAHPERLRILDVLRREAECVCHLEALLAKPQPYVSQQLRLLREAGVIQNEQIGHNVYTGWLTEKLSPGWMKFWGRLKVNTLISLLTSDLSPAIALSVKA